MNLLPIALLTACALGTQMLAAGGGDETAFVRENEAAMRKMMAAMTIRPTGDVDQDFAAVMIAHHQGAIEMAEAELRHGRNEQLRRLSQEIMVTQTQEIAAMRLAAGGTLAAPPTDAARVVEPRR